MGKTNCSTIIAWLVLCASLANGATYTVCSSGCDYTTTAALFSAVDLAGGDIVELRATTPGGTATFTGHIEPGANDFGSDGNPLIIRGRAGDTIIVDGQQTRTYGYKVDGAGDYIRVSNIKFTGSTWHQIYVNGSAGDKVLGFQFESNTVETAEGTTLAGQDTREGMFLNYIEAAQIVSNYVYTAAAEITNQTDGIFVGNTSGTNTIRNNFIKVQNTYSEGHNDCLQMSAVNDRTVGVSLIYSNTFHHLTTATSYVQVVFIEYPTNGSIYFTNNVLVNRSQAPAYTLTFTPKAVSSALFVCDNNSIFIEGKGYGVWFDDFCQNPYYRRNALHVSNSVSSVGVRFQGTNTTPSQVNYNITYYVNASGNQFYAAGDDNSTFSEWQGLGYDANGFNTAPGFVDSAGLNLGITTSSLAYNGGDIIGAFGVSAGPAITTNAVRGMRLKGLRGL